MKNMHLIALRVLLAGSLWCGSAAYSAPGEGSQEREPDSEESSEVSSDFEYWSQYSFHMKTWNKLTLDFHAEGWVTNDSSRLSATFVGPQLTYRAHRNLWLGLAAKRIDVEDAANIDGRLEIDLYPRVRLSDNWFFDTRHRVELIHREDLSDQTVFRHLLRWTRELDTDSYPSEEGERWTHLTFSNEFFHEDNGGYGQIDRIVENHFIPLAAKRQLSDRSSLEFFAMIKSSRDMEGEWNHDYVLGTAWSLSP